MNGPPLRRGYVIGIGSNIAPERNVPRILRALLDQFGALRMSRIVRTRPVGMRTVADFLNLAVFVETDLDARALKAACNRIETALGRNRADPGSAHKDRPADLDILFPVLPGAPPRPVVEGEYQRAVVAELLATLALAPPPAGLPRGEAVDLGGVSAGEVAAAVHRQGGAGDEIVVEQCA
ncbi:2-amino-4-hydroxy-6-hydroxymethyldihydropteridine diphosphokinase [Acidihalobacter ferrooxydans]|uniref:2-amino-4-hydroxy-6-hydroxymethyldihydropteridine pyrophosphokinase n=1 Tax=Acidihalobacter ferrooxydans TaxID=1765967 RepID=A0A1P8UE22_9GAMM|nr:2-amino-4-hydroxy-6-hydroxymethyldihydropteridine diphosphokinase [Acidihalobacter ferrooxydans]APZ42073.1 2-amino-4-hydroxy-6-hydroxymethyldihydropteridine diphosphokinase [Acidihalobacter ferrooxydans]